MVISISLTYAHHYIRRADDNSHIRRVSETFGRTDLDSKRILPQKIKPFSYLPTTFRTVIESNPAPVLAMRVQRVFMRHP